MANKTLIDAVNEIFKRTGNIVGDASTLTSLTDSARQHPIDVAVQVINEGTDELYSYTPEGLPLQQAEATLTLATNTREYTLASDIVRLHFPLVDRTNTQYISRFPGGYDAMLLWDIQQNYTGLPIYGEISPITGKFRVAITPTSVENGKIYTYEYEKDVGLVNATDQLPFNNTVFRSMVPVWVQLFKREEKNQFDEVLYKASLGRASRYLSEQEPRPSYSPKPQAETYLDPFTSTV